MNEKILCVLVGYDDETQKYLSEIQKNLYDNGFVGTQTKSLLQHITLGTFVTEKEQELVNKVLRVSNEYNAFNITFNHIGVFGGSKVLFIAPDPNSQLLKLKEIFGSSYNWTPHTTMLIDEPKVIYTALPIVASNFRSFQGQVQSIHLYEFWPTRHICSFVLNKRV